MRFEDLIFIRDFVAGIFYSLGGEILVSFFSRYGGVMLVLLFSLYIILTLIHFLKERGKKIVYFVRHGETILNAQRVRQGSAGKLSVQGVKQAEFLATRLMERKIDVIFASPFERTQETAKIISKKLHKKIILNDLLAERRNPSEIVNKSYDDPEVVKIIGLIDQSFHAGGLRFSDEENFDDLKTRAENLLSFITKRNEQHLLMVTHGIFLKMVISFMLHRENLTPEEYVKYSYFNNATNAGITICEYDPQNQHLPTRGWKLLVWDDYERKDESHKLHS